MGTAHRNTPRAGMVGGAHPTSTAKPNAHAGNCSASSTDSRRAATTALTLEEKPAGQKQIKALKAQRNQKRCSLFDAQDQVDRQREALIANIEGKLQQKTGHKDLLSLRWKPA